MNLKLRMGIALTLTVTAFTSGIASLQAANRGGAHRAAPQNSGAVVYPQFARQGEAVRWIKEQMPIKVWVSHGISIDGFVDSNGIPRTNTNNTDGWPDLVIEATSNPQLLSTQPLAPGYSEQQYQAAVDGINQWKQLEREGLLSYELTDRPDEADVFVFWTNHFVNKLGLALFENDTKGYTAKYLLPVNQVVSALQRNDVDLVKRSLKPVAVILRTQEQDGTSISYPKMKASAAHEFGHALGIDGHSPFPADLMSRSYGRGVVSPNDIATMRYLYKIPAQKMP